MDHCLPLCSVLLDEDLWRWLPSRVRTSEEMQEFVLSALKLCEKEEVLPFAIIHKPENAVVGTTRFLTIDRSHYHIEIGSTIIAAAWQRTAVNTEAKYLMLRHAFESLRCIRVQFQTDELNTRSRSAIMRLGATEEGLFRNHKICWDGRIRNTVYYSIIDTEWPAVKRDLEEKLNRSYPNSA
jgi:RimJ/RimL family protein N-acetyltransferase